MCASKGIAIALGLQQAPYCAYGDDEAKEKVVESTFAKYSPL